MTDIVNDVSTLTAISEKDLHKLSRKVMCCICEAVQEDLLENKDSEISEMDIGIGILYIKHVAGTLKYHFEPCDMLNRSLKSIVKGGPNMFDAMVNDGLVKKFEQVYKDLC